MKEIINTIITRINLFLNKKYCCGCKRWRKVLTVYNLVDHFWSDKCRVCGSPDVYDYRKYEV